MSLHSPSDIGENVTGRHLRERWLTLARIVWFAVAALTIGLNAAGIPYAYAESMRICTSVECADVLERLTPDELRALQTLGIPVSFFASYMVGLAVITWLAYGTVAAVIFSRRFDDPMALFAAFTLLTFGGPAAAGTMKELAEMHPSWWFPVASLGYLGQVSLVALFCFFPDGRCVPRWTRWLVVAALVFFIPANFHPQTSLGRLANSELFLVFPAGIILAQIYRYRYVTNPLQRQQTKWVVFGIAAGLGGFTAIIVAGSLLLVPEQRNNDVILGVIAATGIYGSLTVLPLSIGMAILRSRLYDIDLLINRTLVYGTLTAMLALIYVSSVVVLQALARPLTGQDPPQIVTVTSTLAIAALFTPLRRRIQAIIDRRFYRRKYDATRTLVAFSARLRDEVDLSQLADDLLAVVEETMQPSQVSLWLRAPQRRHKV